MRLVLVKFSSEMLMSLTRAMRVTIYAINIEHYCRGRQSFSRGRRQSFSSGCHFVGTLTSHWRPLRVLKHIDKFRTIHITFDGILGEGSVNFQLFLFQTRFSILNSPFCYWHRIQTDDKTIWCRRRQSECWGADSCCGYKQKHFVKSTYLKVTRRIPSCPLLFYLITTTLPPFFRPVF